MTDEAQDHHMKSVCEEFRVSRREKKPEEEKEKDGEGKKDGTRSRSSSTSSEDYIIILPDCFDTSRPLGESMYRYCMQGSDLHDETRDLDLMSVRLILSCPSPVVLQLCSVSAW